MYDYFVIPIFWGDPFPAVKPHFPSPPTPYTPQELVDKLRTVADCGYFSLLREYGANDVLFADPLRFDDPWPATPDDGYYAAHFKTDDLTDFLTRHLPDVPMPVNLVPGVQGAKAIYLIVLPNSSQMDDHTDAIGYHYTDLKGNPLIWTWIYSNGTIDGGTQVATHEIVEAVGRDYNFPKELCDDCHNANSDGARVNGIKVETYYDSFFETCEAPSSNWLELDSNSDSVSIVADVVGGASQLYQLHRTGRIWIYTGTPHTGWTEIGNDTATSKLAASGGNLYRLQKNTGKIFAFQNIFSPTLHSSRWVELDNNSASIDIVADGSQLYQLHNNGQIWIYTGTPHTGWAALNSGNASKIAASGGHLYQVQNGGKIFEYLRGRHTHWMQLDDNPHTLDIVADGNNLYQIHDTGVIWVYTGTPNTGWTALDTTGDTKKMSASQGLLYQIRKDGRIWKHQDGPPPWQQIDANYDSIDITAAGQYVYQIHQNGKIFQFPSS